MAYNPKKLANVGALKALAQELKSRMAAEAANDHLTRKIVDSVEAIDLTAADAAQYIYMVPRADAADGNRYDEYMVIGGALERVGSWAVDLSGYVTKEQLSAAVPGIATDEEVTEMLAEVFSASTPSEEMPAE